MSNQPSVHTFPGILEEALMYAPTTRAGKKFDRGGMIGTAKQRDRALKDYISSGDATELAEYADAITVAFTDYYGRNLLNKRPTLGAIRGLNTTSLANMAYISLYAKDATIRSEIHRLLASVRTA